MNAGLMLRDLERLTADADRLLRQLQDDEDIAAVAGALDEFLVEGDPSGGVDEFRSWAVATGGLGDEVVGRVIDAAGASGETLSDLEEWLAEQEAAHADGDGGLGVDGMHQPSLAHRDVMLTGRGVVDPLTIDTTDDDVGVNENEEVWL